MYGECVLGGSVGRRPKLCRRIEGCKKGEEEERGLQKKSKSSGPSSKFFFCL